MQILGSGPEHFGVIIESADVANAMREMFDLAWEEAGKQDTKIRSSLSKTPKKRGREKTKQ